MKSLKLLSAVLWLASAVFFLESTANATIIPYVATLSGANEVPVVASAGTGIARVTVDTVANTILLNVTFTGLNSNDVAAHIHCCQPLGTNGAVATVPPSFPSFPLGVTSGSFTNTFSLLDSAFYNPTFVTNNGGTVASAEAALLAGLAAGNTYFNIHTLTSGGGEIRGQLALPEPSSFILTGLALASLAFARRRFASHN